MGRQPCAADDGATIPEPPVDVVATLYVGIESGFAVTSLLNYPAA